MSAVQRYALASPDFEAKLAQSQEIIEQAAQTLSPLSQASSLSAEDMVITHLLAKTGRKVRIFVLDTGKLHAQTLELVAQIEHRYGLKVEVFKPHPDTAAAFEQMHGQRAMYQSLELRKQCCAIRKSEPLTRALAGQRGWLTGLRRQQSASRAEVAFMEADGDRTKVNPLAHWTTGDVWHYIGREAMVYNRLHDEFFPSIGCAPCTRAVSLGEDLRSGRWWWEEARGNKECGLHTRVNFSMTPLQKVRT